MKRVDPWLMFRSISAACLAALLAVIAFWVYVAKNPAAEGLEMAVQIVLPPVVLFLLGFFIDRCIHLTDRIAARYGYRRIGVVAYIFLVLAVALGRSAIGHLGSIATLILVVGGLLPGLLLISWWGIRKIGSLPAPKQN